MDYSTFNIKNFFIKKGSTLPELKYPITQYVMEQFGITDEMFENVAVTFSMIDANTGLFRVANVAASLIINTDRASSPAEEQYTLVYKFKEYQTAKAGRYLGTFIIDFLGDSGCGKIELPISGHINITISDGITKTTVI